MRKRHPAVDRGCIPHRTGGEHDKGRRGVWERRRPGIDSNLGPKELGPRRERLAQPLPDVAEGLYGTSNSLPTSKHKIGPGEGEEEGRARKLGSNGVRGPSPSMIAH